MLITEFKIIIQTFSGITVDQYISEPNSDLTVQQVVAAAFGYNVAPASVNITSVVADPRSPDSDIVVSYIVTASSAPFIDTAAAYAVYTAALSSSIATGSFQQSLKAQATANLATYLADGFVVARQADIEEALLYPPNANPIAPAYLYVAQVGTYSVNGKMFACLPFILCIFLCLLFSNC